MIKLGEKITLEGFEYLEPGNITIIKKMVGNFVRIISENREFTGLTLHLNEKYNITGVLRTK